MATPDAVMLNDACYRAVFENSPVEAVILDEDGVIVAANRAWRDFGAGHGGRRDGHVGTRYVDACPAGEDAAQSVREGLLRILEGASARFEQEYACPSGEAHRWFLLDARACRFGDRKAVLVTHFDITRRFLAEHRGDHDPVTGLLTRRAFAERLRQGLARAERAGRTSTSGAVIFVALDEIAHLTGAPHADTTVHVLRTLADRLQHELRTVDAIARIGEAEFVLLAEDTAPAGARRLAERVLHKMEAPVDAREAGHGPRCSIGISHFSDDGATAARLILAADRARQEAPRRGAAAIASTRD